jgi:hypothetical protein
LPALIGNLSANDQQARFLSLQIMQALGPDAKSAVTEITHTYENASSEKQAIQTLKTALRP